MLTIGRLYLKFKKCNPNFSQSVFDMHLTFIDFTAKNANSDINYADNANQCGLIQSVDVLY